MWPFLYFSCFSLFSMYFSLAGRLLWCCGGELLSAVAGRRWVDTELVCFSVLLRDIQSSSIPCTSEASWRYWWVRCIILGLDYSLVSLQSLLVPVGVALSQVGGALGGPMPGPDRPWKQASYAKLSHPANAKWVQYECSMILKMMIRTVMARTTVGEPVPLHSSQPQHQFGGYGGARFYWEHWLWRKVMWQYIISLINVLK